MRRRYNISRQIWDNLHKDQGGVCAICRQSRALCVDHDHVTNEVRGLLCNNCNLMLGHAGDNVSVFSQAILYLNNYVSHTGPSQGKGSQEVS